jgi:hypothetical protein
LALVGGVMIDCALAGAGERGKGLSRPSRVTPAATLPASQNAWPAACAAVR